MSSRNNPRGSQWLQWDLHFHTPGSYDYHKKNTTNKQLIDKLINEQISVVAITDHHTMDLDRIKNLKMLAEEKLTILPGIELRDEHGGKPIHYICLFPEDCDIDHVWTTFQGSLGLTQQSIVEKGGNEKVYVPIKDAAQLTRRLGGIISIHAGEKANSIEEISNREQFQQRIKYDITKQYVDLMEIGQIKDIAEHKNVIFPAIGFEKPLIIGSDNHNINNFTRKATTWLKADPTFKGLLMVLREPSARVYIGELPNEIVRERNNPTKIIDRIAFSPKRTLPTSQKWFSSEVLLNGGLVAIIGNKGSGKSAFADTIGLLGSTRNSNSFSFLNDHRFCHPINGLAQHFDGKMVFASGEQFDRPLNYHIKSEEAERVKYLPQDHIENVCNELASKGDSVFEKELKSVIFSHVPIDKRLGQQSLDNLINFSANEKNKRLDTLIKSLKDYTRSRVKLEAQLEPGVSTGYEALIKKKEIELESHIKIKPVTVVDPSKCGTTTSENSQIISSLASAKSQKKKIDSQIKLIEGKIEKAETKRAISVRLTEAINNFGKDWLDLKKQLSSDLNSLGIDIDELINITIDLSKIKAITAKEVGEIKSQRQFLNSTEHPGLLIQKSSIEKDISKLQSRLDGPNRNYQKYLKELDDWTKKKAIIEGDTNSPESLEGLKFSLASLSQIPDKINTLTAHLLKIAEQIHAEKKGIAELYSEYYGPVQSFINSHEIAKDKLNLEFKAELTNDGFANSLLPFIAQNKRGSFMGLEEGKKRIDLISDIVEWQDWNSVKSFLETIDKALHFDLRESALPKTFLSDQLRKDAKPEELLNFIYGLEYVSPRYILKWDGKELSMLSPGERGTLLLVFYLLIDKSDVPLIIDQPEGNLDNHTVAKILVDCIKEARRKRQVIIVTHNPNLAVVCDADQVVHAILDIQDGNKITYITGSLENPEMNVCATNVLEGTRPAFDIRGAKYDIVND